MKNFEKLTDRQKTTAQNLINKTYSRIINIIDTHEYINNIDKKNLVINDSIDIYYYHISNKLEKQSFKNNLIAMFFLYNKKEYILKTILQ